MDIETENGSERQNDLKTFSKDSSQSSDDLLHEGPSNNDVLGIAFYSFLGFTIVQTSFAIRAKSSAMMADSSAMFVDAGTYLCNMLAERLKSRALSKEEELLPQQVLQHKLKLQKLYLESFPPLFSVITLLYLTFATFQGSVITLFGPADTVVDDEEEPNLKLMMFFSFLNLLLDIVNVTCFARVNQAVMTPANFDTNTEKSPLIQNDGTSTTLDTSLDDDEMLEDELINLNMCSAWTVSHGHREIMSSKNIKFHFKHLTIFHSMYLPIQYAP